MDYSCPEAGFEKRLGGMPAGILFSPEEREKVSEPPVILVVEDDWVLRQALQTELERAGWIVREAESGETALEILHGEQISLLITDIRLGGAATGWDVADAGRAKNPKLPVVYLSGNASLEARRVSDSVFVAKPLDEAKLMGICRALLKTASGSEN